MTTKQEQLFESEDLVAKEYERMKGFLANIIEDFDLEEEEGCVCAIEAMTIAAESLARTMAYSRGDVEHDLDDFASEILMGRINGKDEHEALQFDMNEKFKDIIEPSNKVTEMLINRAYAIAEVAVLEKVQENNIGFLKEVAA